MKSIRSHAIKSSFIKSQKKFFAGGSHHKIDYNLKNFDLIVIGGLNSGTVVKYLQHSDFHGTIAGFCKRTKFFNEHFYQYMLSSQLKAFKYNAGEFTNSYDADASAAFTREIVDIKPEKNQVIDDKGTVYTYKSLLLNTGLNQTVENMPFLLPFVNDNDRGTSRVFINDASSEFHIERNKRMFQLHKDNDFLVYLPEHPNRKEAYDNWYLALDNYISWGIQSGTFSRKIKVRVITPNNYLFRYPFADEVIREECASRTSIELHFGYHLTNVEIVDKGNNNLHRYATFKNKATGEEMKLLFGSLLVTPENKKRQIYANNDLTDEHGQVKVNPYTLQHAKYPNIFAFGDCINADTTKSLFATLNQSSVVRNNLVDYLHGKEFKAIYQGYSSFTVLHGIDRLFVFSHYYNYEPAWLNFYVPRAFGLLYYCLKVTLEKEWMNKIYQKKPNYAYPFVMKNKYYRPIDENSFLKKNNITKEQIYIHGVNSVNLLGHHDHHHEDHHGDKHHGKKAATHH